MWVGLCVTFFKGVWSIVLIKDVISNSISNCSSTVVWCARGGEGASWLIPYLEALPADLQKQRIRDARKTLVGYSDATRVPADGVRVADYSRHNVGNDCQWPLWPADRTAESHTIVRIEADLRRRSLKCGVTAFQDGGWQLDAGRELAGHAV